LALVITSASDGSSATLSSGKAALIGAATSLKPFSSAAVNGKRVKSDFHAAAVQGLEDVKEVVWLNLKAEKEVSVALNH
ncbi:MAG: hypothetical protein LBR84_01155, partial [Tannerella sp.]|nr:hypothetical protein [Tannerella sp.]